MSHSWSVYCRTCKDEHHLSIHNGLEACRALIQNATQIAALKELFDDPRINIVACVENSNWLRPHWFTQHAGHVLVPRNDYGRLDGTCGELVLFGSDWSCCPLPPGHEGAHVPEEGFLDQPTTR